jgi:hypothetical protein
VAAADVLGLADAAYLNVTPTASDGLVLADLATATVGKVFQDTITLGDLATVSRVGASAATSLLALSDSVAFIVVHPDTRFLYTPFVGAGAAGSPTPPGPLVGPTTGLSRCQFVYPVVSPTVFVSLRNPEFGNKDRLQFNRISRETRGGTLVVLADPMWPKVETQVLTFTGLAQTQAQSLLSFLQSYLGQEVGFMDWEGRYWKGIVTNTTDPVVQDGRGAMYTASLEFECELTTWTP